MDERTEALKAIITLRNRKEEVPDELYQEAGVSATMTLKELQKEIGKKKKIVSNLNRQEMVKELEAEAAENGMTLEEYKASLRQKESTGKNVKERKQEREKARRKKECELNNESDIKNLDVDSGGEEGLY